MTQQLPVEAIEADRRLDSASSKAAEALMHHRWHWTLDETNPDRVSFSAYARAVGRSEGTIRGHAKGHVLLTEQADSGTGPRMGAAEAQDRTRMTAETEAATEAVAKAHGVGFRTARLDRAPEVRRVREMARDRAEQKGTTVEEEAQRAAEWLAKSQQAEKDQAKAKAVRLGNRFVEMERELDGAKRRLTNALNIAHQVEWEDEHRQLLASTVANIRALLGLIDVAIAGEVDVDWDAELEKLSGGAS